MNHFFLEINKRMPIHSKNKNKNKIWHWWMSIPTKNQLNGMCRRLIEMQRIYIFLIICAERWLSAITTWFWLTQTFNTNLQYTKHFTALWSWSILNYVFLINWYYLLLRLMVFLYFITIFRNQKKKIVPIFEYSNRWL